MRKLIKLGVFLLVCHAFYRFAPIYLHDVQLQWDVKEAAHAWRELTPTQVEDEVLALAARHDVPIGRQHLNVRGTGTRIQVDIAYAQPVEFLPGWKYPWKFDSTIETWTLNRPTK